jgi:hypothetical protein
VPDVIAWNEAPLFCGRSNAEAMSQMWWGDPKAFERAFSGVAA